MGRHKNDTIDETSIIWECGLCHDGRGKSSKNTVPRYEIYHNQNDFKDHYDRTCHICFSEFTSKLTKDKHQISHSSGISKDYKSLCSLCGKKFKVMHFRLFETQMNVNIHLLPPKFFYAFEIFNNNIKKKFPFTGKLLVR